MRVDKFITTRLGGMVASLKAGVGLLTLLRSMLG